jgi:hypothetical protein
MIQLYQSGGIAEVTEVSIQWSYLHTHAHKALFTAAKLWNQPKCPTMGEWIKKMWYIYTMEYYSATKKNEIMSFAEKWMEPEIIVLNEKSQTEKSQYCMFPVIYRI